MSSYRIIYSPIIRHSAKTDFTIKIKNELIKAQALTSNLDDPDTMSVFSTNLFPVIMRRLNEGNYGEIANELTEGLDTMPAAIRAYEVANGHISKHDMSAANSVLNLLRTIRDYANEADRAQKNIEKK